MAQAYPKFVLEEDLRYLGFQHTTFQMLVDENPSTPWAASSWLAGVQSFANTQERHWDDARHAILREFLRDSLTPSEDSRVIFGFQSMLDMCLVSLPPASPAFLDIYSRLLHLIAHRDHLAQPLSGYNVQVVSAILFIFFPLGGTQESKDHITNSVIPSYLMLAANSSSSDSVFLALGRSNISQLWDAIGQYLTSGCPGSINTQTTLEVMCHLNHWFWTWNGHEHNQLKAHWSTELSLLESLPSCPPLTSMLALVKTESVDSLRRQLREADWDKCKYLLAHPLLSGQDLELSSADVEFDLEHQREDAEEKAVQLRQLSALVHTRLQGALDVILVEFLEACSDVAPPCYVPETLTQITVARIFPFAQPRNEKRFAHSIAALIEARNATPEHTWIWKHLILESSLLRVFMLKDQSAIAIIQNGLKEAELDDPWEKARVDELLKYSGAAHKRTAVVVSEEG
ncbi:hypothetical protein C8R46DRAFT_33212 [Mycena filopes]|nr:hypothetical protein C8R46DRAFT_33212 [Mycena filopes]